MVLRIAREGAGPELRVGIHVRILRVSSTHSSRGKSSRISEVFWIGEWLGWNNQVIQFGFWRPCSIWGFLSLSHQGRLRDLHDTGHRLCSLPSISSVCHFSLYKSYSDQANSRWLICWGSSTNNTAPKDDMVPTRFPALLLRGRPHPICFQRGRTAGGTTQLLCSTGTRFVNAALASFHFTQHQQLAVLLWGTAFS